MPPAILLPASAIPTGDSRMYLDWANKTFKGFHRSDGSVGTANYWLVVPMVFCENRNLEVLQEALVAPWVTAGKRLYQNQAKN